MLIQTTVTITKRDTVNKEIELPYYSKSEDVSFCVNEDESVLRVSNYSIGRGIHLFKAEHGESAYLHDAVAAEPITREQFEADLQSAVEYMDGVLTAICAKRKPDPFETIVRENTVTVDNTPKQY